MMPAVDSHKAIFMIGAGIILSSIVAHAEEFSELWWTITCIIEERCRLCGYKKLSNNHMHYCGVIYGAHHGAPYPKRKELRSANQ